MARISWLIILPAVTLALAGCGIYPGQYGDGYGYGGYAQPYGYGQGYGQAMPFAMPYPQVMTVDPGYAAGYSGYGSSPQYAYQPYQPYYQAPYEQTPSTGYGNGGPYYNNQWRHRGDGAALNPTADASQIVTDPNGLTGTPTARPGTTIAGPQPIFTVPGETASVPGMQAGSGTTTDTGMLPSGLKSDKTGVAQGGPGQNPSGGTALSSGFSQNLNSAGPGQTGQLGGGSRGQYGAPGGQGNPYLQSQRPQQLYQAPRQMAAPAGFANRAPALAGRAAPMAAPRASAAPRQGRGR